MDTTLINAKPSDVSYEDITSVFSVLITSIIAGIMTAIQLRNNIQMGGAPTPIPQTINATPSTINATPSTINATPSTINATPSTINATPSTINATPSTINAPAEDTFKKQMEDLQKLVNSKWLDTFFTLAGTINNTLHNVFENQAIKALDTVTQHTVGDLGKNPAESLLNKLQHSASIAKQLTLDPAFQLALKNLSQDTATLGLDALDTVQPQINEIMKRALDTLNQTAEKSAKGLVDSGLGFIMSIIGNIPGYGGIVTLVMACLKGFNDGAIAGAPGVKFSVSTFITAFNTVLKMIQDLNNNAYTLKGHINDVIGAFNNLKIPSVEGVNLQLPGVQLPGVKLPGVKLPGVKLPGVKLPGVKLPSLPGIKEFGVAKTLGNPLTMANTRLANAAATATTSLANAATTSLANAATTSLANAATTSLANAAAMRQKGGVKIRKQINHITRRLRHTINQFMRGKHHTRKNRNKR